MRSSSDGIPLNKFITGIKNTIINVMPFQITEATIDDILIETTTCMTRSIQELFENSIIFQSWILYLAIEENKLYIMDSATLQEFHQHLFIACLAVLILIHEDMSQLINILNISFKYNVSAIDSIVKILIQKKKLSSNPNIKTPR